MTTLRDAVVWCLSLQVPWSAQDVAEMSGCAVQATRAYLTQLAKMSVVLQVNGQYRAGARTATAAFLAARPRTHPGGRSASYRQSRAARERLLDADAAAKRTARLTSNTSQTLSTSEISTEAPGDEPMAEGSGVSIGEAANALSVSVNTIRNWDRLGIIRCGRTPTGHRRVPESEIVRLRGSILGIAQHTTPTPGTQP